MDQKDSMSLISRIADRLILRPTNSPIDPGENEREIVFAEDGIQVESYVSTIGNFDSPDIPPSQKLAVLKFPGTGGRAERASIHPCELAIDQANSKLTAAKVWTLNHRGYGRSSGPASLQNFEPTIRAFFEFVSSQIEPETLLLATGNSLGCISALFAASQLKVDGLLLRNPPPLARLISSRRKYNFWSLGFAKLVAAQIPSQLCAIENATKSDCPALFVSSEKDKVVPPEFQKHVFEAYRGLKKQFLIQDADHHHRIPETQEKEYTNAVAWLFSEIKSYRRQSLL